MPSKLDHQNCLHMSFERHITCLSEVSVNTLFLFSKTQPYVAQAGLELQILFFSTFQVLGLQACTIMSSSCQEFPPGWRDGSVVKSMHSSCRNPSLVSVPTLGNSQLLVAPALWNLMPWVHVCVYVCACTRVQDRGHQIPWRYELQMTTTSCLPWPLGTELKPVVIEVNALNLYAISPACSVTF